MLMMFLFVLTLMSICINVAWALGMILSNYAFKELAALSAVSGLLLLTIFSKYIRAGADDLGNRKLLIAYESFAIICGCISLILGLIYLIVPGHYEHNEKAYAGHRNSEPVAQ